ncbi:uncharacterized protein TNCT_299481 [Trichonephila clavata]|uniref:Uncharacterized protein n=1 Tax=Trichonephila clavata TaxID=2740835 RepID=A0A8X6LL13_TRICU|nr:uncharacterized protein TNCT_299481 [Trichonephila clavata]
MTDMDISTLTDEEICGKISFYETEIQTLDARQSYVCKILRIEKETNGENTENYKKLEKQTLDIAEKITSSEGKMLELFPCPIPKCNTHNPTTELKTKNKPSKKRPAEQIAGTSKTTTSVDKILKNQTNAFKFQRKSAKIKIDLGENVNSIHTTNRFDGLNTVTEDVEDVTPAAPKIKVRPIMMKLYPDYNLILQELHRKYPSATNTHTAGYIKIQPENQEHHHEITEFLTNKKV